MVTRSIQLTSKITVLAANNPKRGSSHTVKRFALYRNGMSVQQYIDAVAELAKKNPAEAKYHTRAHCWADLPWDADRGFITIEGYTPKAKPAKPTPAAPVKEQLAASLKATAPTKGKGKPAPVTPAPVASKAPLKKGKAKVSA